MNEDTLMTRDTVLALLDLEKRYGLLSKDGFHQEDLFKMQDELMGRMIKSANQSKTSSRSIGALLENHAPHLFKAE